MNEPVPGNIKASEIREQLRRIQSSPRFVAGPRIAQFIGFVVEETLNGRANRIKQYTVAVNGLGEPEDFDPISNPAVRILARRVRRALNDFYDNEGADDQIRIDLRKGAYVPYISYQQQSQTLSSAAADLKPKLEEPKVAVLPYSCASSDLDCEQFARSITFNLTSGLTAFPGIEVIGRHSADHYASATSPISQLRRDIDVNYALVGTIDSVGSMKRVCTELIDCTSHEAIWSLSKNIDILTETPLELLDQITARIAATIGDYHGVIPRRVAESIRGKVSKEATAYHATILFHDYLANYSEKRFRHARLVIERIVDEQPDYALGWAQLAELHCDAYTSWQDSSGWPEAALNCANRALALDPKSQEACNIMAYIHLLSGEHEAAIAEAESGIEINPKAAFEVAWAAFIIGLSGEVERGMQLIEDMERLNPYQPGWLRGVAYIYHQERREFQQCLHEARRIGMQDHPIGPLMQASAAGHLGNTNVARAALQSMSENFPESLTSPVETLSIWFHPKPWLANLIAGIDKAKKLTAQQL